MRRAGQALLLILAGAAFGAGWGYRLGRTAGAPPALEESKLAAPLPAEPSPGNPSQAASGAEQTATERRAQRPASAPGPDAAGSALERMLAGDADITPWLARASTDPAWRTQLWALLRATPDPTQRQALLALLAQAPTEEALAYIDELAANRDPARRREAWEWLAGLPIDDPGVRERVGRALRGEADGEAIAPLVAGLQPGLLAEEDSGPIAQSLLALARSGEAPLRAAALPALSQWLPAQELESLYLPALGDPDPGVRAAALAGIEAAGLRAPATRSALLRLAGDRMEPPGNRHAALIALAGFRLSRAEMALYRELQREVPTHPGEG